nr:Zinc finger MYND domain-containing protein 12 [Polyrhizophydium stewartii]
MAAIHINPLSNPKVMLSDKEHQNIDSRGIHEKICQLLIPLRTPVAVLGSEEERAHREKQTKARQYDLAIPAALQALRFSMDVSGPSSIDLVPSYLLLGEASIGTHRLALTIANEQLTSNAAGLKQYKQAEDYLSLAKWAILKAEHCENHVRSQLHRNFGLLYASQGRFDKALSQLALDIYYISVAKNPEDIAVTGGYFQLGTVFHKQNRIDHATAVFDKIVTIWKAVLETPDVHLGETDTAAAGIAATARC